ncbi:hypothetical protein [Flavobacterium humidisoli]|uniref:hypothetical protein n=1 Tax=Flavobacterium humidisoli TaxID=2937442 RepID=UPI003B848E1A
MLVASKNGVQETTGCAFTKFITSVAKAKAPVLSPVYKRTLAFKHFTASIFILCPRFTE